MSVQIELVDIRCELEEFRAKLSFMSIARIAISELIGNDELSENEDEGMFFLEHDLDKELENILLKIQKTITKA